MRKFLLFSSVLLLAFSNQVNAQYITAEDNAGSYNTWVSNDNLGFGFGAWNLYTGGGTAGWFIGNSSTAGFGDININSNSFGLWGNPVATDNWVNADRPITEWGDGYTFSVDMAVAYRNGNKGIDLYNSDSKIWNFNTGSDKYYAGLIGTVLDWTYSQTSIFKLTVTQKGNDLDILLVRGTDTYSTTLNGQNLKGIKLYCSNTMAGSDLNNLFFNNLKVEVSDPTKVSSSSKVRVNGNVTMSGNMTCSDLSINSSNSLTIAPTKSLTVNGKLTNDAGNAGLVIKSDATGTGSLIHNTSDVAATVERYITGSSDLTSKQYHFVCRPFTEDYTSGAWMDSYLFEHNEAATSDATAWTAIGASTTYPLSASKGYLLYYPETAKTYSHTGTLKSDNTSISTAFTSGALYAGNNLVANMYSSALDFSNSSYWTGCDPTIWIWNSAGGNYGTYNRTSGGTNNASKDIPVGQGFFVKVGSAGTLTIDKTARLHSNQVFLKNASTEQNALRLKVDANTYFDEVLVSFNTEATTGYESDFDAKKMIGQDEAPQLSSVASDGNNLSINALPYSDGDVLVPLNFSLTTAANVTFSATGIELFSPYAGIYLEDNELGKVINLREQPNYTINYAGGAADNRFWLRFGSLTVNQKENTDINGTIFASNGKIIFDIPGMQNKNVTLRVFNSIGQLISTQIQSMSGITQIAAPFKSGVYIVKADCNAYNITRKIVVR